MKPSFLSDLPSGWHGTTGNSLQFVQACGGCLLSRFWAGFCTTILLGTGGIWCMAYAAHQCSGCCKNCEEECPGESVGSYSKSSRPGLAGYARRTAFDFAPLLHLWLYRLPLASARSRPWGSQVLHEAAQVLVVWKNNARRPPWPELQLTLRLHQGLAVRVPSETGSFRSFQVSGVIICLAGLPGRAGACDDFGRRKVLKLNQLCWHRLPLLLAALLSRFRVARHRLGLLCCRWRL